MYGLNLNEVNINFHESSDAKSENYLILAHFSVHFPALILVHYLARSLICFPVL